MHDVIASEHDDLDEMAERGWHRMISNQRDLGRDLRRIIEVERPEQNSTPLLNM
jgi:hypothetical protein